MITFLGAFYCPRLSLCPYTFLGPLWWQDECFFAPLQSSFNNSSYPFPQHSPCVLMAYLDHQMYSMTSLPLLHTLGTSQTWQALWFAFLVIFVSNLFLLLIPTLTIIFIHFMDAFHHYKRENSHSRPSGKSPLDFSCFMLPPPL